MVLFFFKGFVVNCIEKYIIKPCLNFKFNLIERVKILRKMKRNFCYRLIALLLLIS